MNTDLDAMGTGDVRPAAAAGSFYPDDPGDLDDLVRALLAAAARLPGAATSLHAPTPLGILVPHAGLAYSGVAAAAAWRLLTRVEATVVILGTNHSAAWLDGVGVWAAGDWRTPIGVTRVDGSLATAVADLGPPFVVDPACHAAEHSIEVQLPLLRTVAPDAAVVPLAVALGTGEAARDAGRRLGTLLRARTAAGARIVLAISTDMAHYPRAAAAEAVTDALVPSLAAVDPVDLGRREASVRDARIPDLVCGMCGIEPAVLGLAALREMGATRGSPIMASTSADAGGPASRAVGYLSMRFDA